MAEAVIPSLSISDVTLLEPDNGSVSAVFTIALSAAASRDVTVSYRTGNDLALAGMDYAPSSGRIVIAAGSTSATVSVPVLGDVEFEPRETFTVSLFDPVNATITRGTAFGIINDEDTPATLQLPDDVHFPWQWSLYSPYGVNVLPAWKDYHGDGVRVAVFDQGIDAAHSDLNGNLLAALGRDAATLTGNGLPRAVRDNHATAVAGVIAAERDGSGIVGVAYDAALLSIYSPLNEAVTVFGATVANAYAYARQAGADVVNDSWGFGNYLQVDPNYAFTDDFGMPAYMAAGRELENLATFGRAGLGTVVVQSAGNSYAYGDNTNLHSFQNSRYLITVAASDYFGNVTSYSSPGASILVTAPGGGTGGASGILSTDRVGAAGYAASDYAFVAGTSFSSAIVSGVVALMLDANPNLGYRDVQEILAYSAVRAGSANIQWEFNSATTWNGGGLHYSSGAQRYGFGLVDATAAVRLAESWDAAHTRANLQEVTASHAGQAAIPDMSSSGVTDSIFIGSGMQVERVDVTLDLTHTSIGDLTVELRSPGGITSSLLYRPGKGLISQSGSAQDDIHFTFDSVAYWGEEAHGNWTLRVTDQGDSGTGTLNGWTLKIAGKPASQDDMYVYTDEYAESVRLNPSRGTLDDSGGTDTLNAAAVTTSSTIDLTPGSYSTIARQTLTIASACVIENAIGGDGHDRIMGNAASNELRGMRGDDSLFGGEGNDVLDGGRGNDMLDGGAGTDTAVFASARGEARVTRTAEGYSVTGGVWSGDGTDTLLEVERLQFADMSVALDLNAGGAAGNAARIVGAAFERLDPAVVGEAIGLFDAGYTELQVAQVALASNLFASLAVSRSDVDFVNAVYRNVVGVAPDAAERDFYVGLLQGSGGTMTQAELLVLAAGAAQNAANIGLVGLQQHGLDFV